MPNKQVARWYYEAWLRPDAQERARPPSQKARGRRECGRLRPASMVAGRWLAGGDRWRGRFYLSLLDPTSTPVLDRRASTKSDEHRLTAVGHQARFSSHGTIESAELLQISFDRFGQEPFLAAIGSLPVVYAIGQMLQKILHPQKSGFAVHVVWSPCVLQNEAVPGSYAALVPILALRQAAKTNAVVSYWQIGS